MAEDKVYDANTDATITNAALVGVVNSDDVELDALVGSFAQSDVGTDIAVTAALTLKGALTNNYSLTQPIGLTADITAKALTVTNAMAEDKVYDANTDATITNAALVGVVNSDDVELDALVGSFAQSDVGTDIAVTAALTLKGALTNNYSLTQPIGLTADITAKALTVTNAMAEDKVYDANTDATITNAALVGVINSDDVELDALVGAFDTAAVGTDKPVTAALTLKGALTNNYSLTQPIESDGGYYRQGSDGDQRDGRRQGL